VSEHFICAGEALIDGGKGVRFELPTEAKVGAGNTAPAFVIRFRGQVHAYVNRCSHVPIELDWQAGEFFDHSGLYLICATHGALYAPESGRCLGGRCNRQGLKKLAVIERDGQVFLILNDMADG
jgi:nitrite reductase/ring-hydroxylating ferredoxin subunit